MPLSAGEKLGVYEIVSPLGAGGMGEVYRARDTKLGREVAIKVLPEEFTQHPQKLARFEREARLLAALNHPGIATLYGVEESEGNPFLVMELVEGETLAERIARGPILLNEALEISRQIAEALEAAHEKGVIHRDLKPANIKVDPEGKVKVLDFGLAKAFAEEIPESELSQSPTLSRDATRAGVILGTAAYMSPEQAKGKAVDKRTDIFSFGIVLYEMLTGKKTFKGEDVSEVLASIINTEPDWKALPFGLDPRIQNLLRRCLRKDRKDRLQAIGDARVAIQEVLTEPNAGAIADTSLGFQRTTSLSAVVVAALTGALITGILVWTVLRSPPRLPTRLAVTIPATEQLLDTNIVLSPDGRDLVYGAVRDGITQLYRRSMDQLEAVPIRGTEGGRAPFFSPDGESIGFFADRKLKKVSLAGGVPVTLCDAATIGGGSWGPDDVIVFGSTNLMRVSASGGDSVAITTFEAGERAYDPNISAEGAAVLFSALRSGSSEIAVLSLETGKQRRLSLDGAFPAYVPTGHIVFSRANSLWAIPFDIDRLEATGEPTPVLEGIHIPLPSEVAQFALAGDGSLAYVPTAGQVRRSLVWVDREGKEELVAAEPQSYEEFALSPEGTLLAVRIAADNSDVWVYDLVRNTWMRLTFDPASEIAPVWSPDGKRVAFGGPSFAISWKSADGTGAVETLMENSGNLRPHAFSRDGNVLVFEDRGKGDLSMLSLEGEHTSTPLLHTEFEERNASLSPDGHWMAYESNESGEVEVYVSAFPNVGAGKWQVSINGGWWPLWAPDGRELFYVGPQAMMSVAVSTSPTFTHGRAAPLFDASPYYTPPSALINRRVAIDPSGERFLLLKQGAVPGDIAGPQTIIVVQNWLEELKRLVPTN